jgi:cysteinyl-tRNA synthetase
MHNGHLTLESEKMSKSLGNIVRIRDILDQVPAEALRLLYLETHYRSPLPYSSERLATCLGPLDRIYTAKETAIEASKGADVPLEQLGEAARDAHSLAVAFEEHFDEAMDDDFNTAQALSHLFDLVRAINRFGNDRKQRAKGARAMKPALRAFEVAGEVLGIGAMDPGAFFDEMKRKRLAAAGRSIEEVDALVADRAAARDAKDWARADALRKALDEQGIIVMDGVAGSAWRMRVE